MGCLKFKTLLNEEEDSPTINLKKKLLFIGLEDSGKTTILHFIKSGKFIQNEPTIGLNIETIQLNNLELLIFDVGGKVRSLWCHYYESLSAVVFVIDSSSKARFWEVRQELIKINEELKYQGVPCLVYLNKQDLVGQGEFSEMIESTGVKEVLDIDVIVQKCCGKSGEGVLEGLEKLGGMLRKGKVKGMENNTYSNVGEDFLRLA